ncbi:MAG: hypothetical protein KJ069_10140 [Anaerolineae bacterium]|nr:hypothetical protein [Anaerolineae bacterium]
MDARKLQQLLSQDEGASLDFKQEFYKIYAGDPEAKERQKHELIKDILSLANGNASVAGETAYLIIGASNEFNAAGNRDLHDTSVSRLPDSVALLGMVNAFCEPPLNELQCHTVDIEGKQLFIIAIPFSPHLHELTKRLQTPSQTYSKYVTLVRHNESVEIASAKERAAILKLKQTKLAEMENPPFLVGGIVGFALGFMVGGIAPFQLTEDEDLNREIGPYVGGVVGGVLGQTIGASHHLKYRFQKKYPDRFLFLERIWFLTITLGGYILLSLIKESFKKIWRKITFSKR